MPETQESQLLHMALFPTYIGSLFENAGIRVF